MKIHLLVSSLVAASLFVGCSKQESAPSAAPAPASSAVAASTSTPAAAQAAAGARVITIHAGDTMKFDVTSIEAKPGEEIKVVLKNVGTQPKEIMGHNWVLLKAGVDAQAFSMAATSAKASDYIPESFKDQVIVHTKLLGPNESEEITFKAPSAPGDYPFVCSFPAHFLVGMKGVLTVK